MVSLPTTLFAALASYSQDDVKALKQNPFSNRLDRSDPRFSAACKQTGVRDSVLAHVEVMLPTGQKSVREAIVSYRTVAALFT